MMLCRVAQLEQIDARSVGGQLYRFVVFYRLENRVCPHNE